MPEKNKKFKSSGLLTPILILLITFSIFASLYTNVQKKLLHINLDEQKCNPRYLFFSGFLNPLDKNPWATTLSNFQKCVANNIYKPPKIAREIKQNEYLIRKNNKDMKNSLEYGKTIVSDINEDWTNVLVKKQDELDDISSQKDKIFEEQGFLYKEVAKKTAQLFKVIQSMIIYIEGVIQVKMSKNKSQLDVDNLHNDFMSRYQDTHKLYTQAYEKLDNANWKGSINNARVAISNYKEMTKELDEYMEKNAHLVYSITEGCYQLKYNMDSDKCSALFPNLNKEFVANFPNINKIV
jgi:hypothetical protein